MKRRSYGEVKRRGEAVVAFSRSSEPLLHHLWSSLRVCGSETQDLIPYLPINLVEQRINRAKLICMQEKIKFKQRKVWLYNEPMNHAWSSIYPHLVNHFVNIIHVIIIVIFDLLQTPLIIVPETSIAAATSSSADVRSTRHDSHERSAQKKW